MNTGFFYHVACESAIANHWDYEQDLFTWAIHGGRTYLENPVWSLGEITVNETDILQATQGNITPTLRLFFSVVVDNLVGNPDDTVVMQSMHSGSSEYLYLKDLKEIIG